VGLLVRARKAGSAAAAFRKHGAVQSSRVGNIWWRQATSRTRPLQPAFLVSQSVSPPLRDEGGTSVPNHDPSTLLGRPIVLV
jgi:hypothetical protein